MEQRPARNGARSVEIRRNQSADNGWLKTCFVSIFTVAFWGESCYNHDGQRHMWRFSFRGGHGTKVPWSLKRLAARSYSEAAEFA